MYKTITEGKARIKIFQDKKISKELPVFYNPIMKTNRDISVLLLNSINKTNLQIGLPLAGSGVRGIRFFLELKKNKIKQIHMNDYDKKSIKIIKENCKLNKLKKISISNKGANLFLLNSTGFDYIDIDPFGTPNPFLDASMKRISRDGILAVTATDTGCLAGTYPKACFRKYWAKPLKNEFMHETGLRILIRKIQLIAAQYDKLLIPVFSYFLDHYFRIFFVVDKGKKKLDDLFDGFGYILYCNNCLFRKATKTAFNDGKCPNCSNKLDYAGPLWLGNLFDKKLIFEIFKNLQKNNFLNKDKKLSKFLETVKEESKLDIVSFYDIHEICKIYKIHNVPKLALIIKGIKNKGYRAARTHFNANGIKSDISLKELLKIIKN